MPDVLPPISDALVTVDIPPRASEPRWSETAQPISLLRHPNSDAANRLTDDVAAFIELFLDRKRPLGKNGRATHQDSVGIILGGLLRAGLKGQAVRACQGKSTGAWKGKAIGHRAFWSKVTAMYEAGLVDIVDGVSFVEAGIITGRAAAIRIDDSLRDLAKKAGVTAASFYLDWPLTTEAESASPTIQSEGLVTRYSIPDPKCEARVRTDFRPAQASAVESRRLFIERLNVHLSSAIVEGCQPPVMQASFFADLQLGGRLYAVGPESFQQVSRQNRHTIRLNGQRIVEVDIVASQLSILLAVSGGAIPSDPYAAGELRLCDRRAVKACIAQCLNSGGPPGRWSDQHSADVRNSILRDIGRAMLVEYPELEEPTKFLPESLAFVIPIGRDGWAVGQWLTALEANVLYRALDRLIDKAVIALPLHDAVLVAEQDAEAASEALWASFRDVLGRTPNVRVKDHEVDQELRVFEP